MKNLILIIPIMLCSIIAMAQTDGLSYQAVIIDNQAQEIPGIDVSGNFLSNGSVSLRFTIYNEDETIIYQEFQNTTTDEFGMVNVTIGSGEMTSDSPTFFDEIEWDGSTRDLGVELSYASNNFEELSRQSLLFLPYAYHRNITATGSLTIDQDSWLKGSLTVDGDAEFNGNTTFNDIVVENNSNLQGDVQIGGTTTINGITNLNDELTVNAPANFLGNTNFNTISVANLTDLQGTLNVGGVSTFNNNLLVNNGSSSELTGNLNVQGDALLNGSTTTIGGNLYAQENSFLNGQVTINSSTTGSQSNYSAYGLRLEGAEQGIAVKLTGPRSASKNYITFMDGGGTVHGRIEGQTYSELINSFRFIWDVAMGGFGFAFPTAEAVACGLNLPFPDVAEGIANGVQAGISAAHWVELTANYELNVGVYFGSGGADYAEWLLRDDFSDDFNPGEVVGVRAGKISRNTEGANQILVISTNPIVLGNQPEEGKEYLYERVGFLGQVPVRVVGKVKEGDYILPSGKNDGLAKAYAPADVPTSMFNQIIGIAWESGKSEMLNTINMAIGLNTNDLATKVSDIETELEMVKREMAELRSLVTGEDVYENKVSTAPQKVNTSSKINSLASLTSNALTDEEFDQYIQDYGYIFDEVMTQIKEELIAKGSDYTQYPEIVKLIETPTLALREMRDGQYMESLWDTFETRIKATR